MGSCWFPVATMEWGQWDSEMGVSIVQPHLLPLPTKISAFPEPMTLGGSTEAAASTVR